MMRKEKKTANAVSHGVEASMKNLITAVKCAVQFAFST